MVVAGGLLRPKTLPPVLNVGFVGKYLRLIFDDALVGIENLPCSWEALSIHRAQFGQHDSMGRR